MKQSYQVSGNNDFFFVLQEYAAAGTVNQNYANILLMLLRLRQACDHPLLVKGYNTDSIRKVSSEMAKKLPSDILINLLDILETSAICRVCNVSFFLNLFFSLCNAVFNFPFNAYKATCECVFLLLPYISHVDFSGCKLSNLLQTK